MVRLLTFAAVLLLLVGCEASYREARTAQELHEYKVDGDRAVAVLGRVIRANADICLALKAGCRPDIWVAIGPIGAGSNANTIAITTQTIRFLDRDDELAGVLGHEWAHVLFHQDATPRLGLFGGGGAKHQREYEADCIGAVMAARAGYNPAAAGMALLRTGNTGGGNYPLTIDRARRIDIVAMGVDQRRSRGGIISKDTIREICGVSP